MLDRSNLPLMLQSNLVDTENEGATESVLINSVSILTL